MANHQHEQNATRDDSQREQRGHEGGRSAGSQFQQGPTGGNDRSQRFASPSEHAHGGQDGGHGRVAQRPSGQPSDGEREHTGVFAYQRHGASGQSYGRQSGRHMDTYGQGGDGADAGSEDSDRYSHQSRHGDQGRHGSRAGGYRQSGYETGDDSPIEGGYIGQRDRGDQARAYAGESGGRSGSMGYSARAEGGSGYAEHIGSSGSRSGGFRGLGPRGYRRSDQRLCEDINERLTEDDSIDARDISVDVSDGVVMLSGEVAQRRLKHRIEDMVERCHGVQDIRNEIRVKRSTDQSGLQGGTKHSRA